ncbi:conserved hypothetical protein [Aeropyrum pernix K1]|uniref:Zinc transporter ZupT n=1 Tax=Aeropyrum pernix (strain ATCC 700893 / DSM 11879 / JCM 9820 / NBRC 100138 / K1) TaxID=272557 RepID=Q9YFP6_AERPE|nr:ZIP family metal transporter [Aeropyrum pernix]BAA79115.2 conserved hypothetical protein [Aeropyrum pernix K1]
MNPAITPILLGLVAGITVTFGALTYIVVGRRLGRRGQGVLNALAGGVLAYLALETGHESAAYVEQFATRETLDSFLAGLMVTSIALLGTWLLLSYVERGYSTLVRAPPGLMVSLTVASALGLHNLGEGLAIAASLIEGKVSLAILFAVGFAIHNYTEGFPIAAPLAGEKKRTGLRTIIGLSLLAGLPVVPGAMVYYLGSNLPGLAIATLYTVAAASIVYAMLHINLSALSRLGGLSSPSFWSSLFLGIALAYVTESIILIAGLH